MSAFLLEQNLEMPYNLNMSKIKKYIKNIILLSALITLLSAAFLMGCAEQNEIILEETAIQTLTPQATATIEPTPEPTAVPQPIRITSYNVC